MWRAVRRIMGTNQEILLASATVVLLLLVGGTPRWAGAQVPAGDVALKPAGGAADAPPQPPGKNPAEALEFLEDIEVVGTTPVPGPGTALRDVPASVQFFGAKGLERQRPASAADFLERNAGSVSVNSGQGNPYQPDVSYRGFTASPLLGTPQGLSVFLDGVRLNEPFGDVVNWDLLPPSAISSIQLISGSTPALGLNTLGGALAIYTKSGSAYPGYAVNATGGSFGRFGGGFEAGGSKGDLDWFATGNYQRDDGWARHNPSRVGQLFAKVGYQTERTDADLSLVLADNLLEGTQTIPRSWLDAPREAYTYPDRNANRVAHLNLKGSTYLSKELLLGGEAYFRKLQNVNTSSNVNDAYDPAAVPLPSTALNDRSIIDQRGYGAALQVTLLWPIAGLKNQLAAGATADLGRVHFTQATQDAEFTADRGAIGAGDFTTGTDVRTTNQYYGLYVTDTLTLADGLSLTVSGRYNLARVRIENLGAPADDALNGEHAFERLNPSVGLAWTPRPWVTTFATYNEGMRVPTPMELTCADPSAPCKLPNNFLADPPLKRVVSRTAELGARGRLGAAGQWSASVYQTRLSDDIQFINDPTSGLVSAGYFANVGETRRQGAELGLGLRTGDVAWSLAYGWVSATFQAPFQFASATNSAAVDTNADGVPDTVRVRRGDHIPGIPAHSAKLRADWEVTSRLAVGASVQYTSSTYARGDENNQDANGMVPGYVVVYVDAGYTIVSGLRVGLKIDNLFNARYSNFGVLGRNFFTGPGRTFGPPVGMDSSVEQFRAVSAPRGAWVTLEYRLGAGHRQPGEDQPR